MVAPSAAAASSDELAWPDRLQRDPAQAVGGATATAVAHPPPAVAPAVEQLRSVASRAAGAGEPTNGRQAAEAAAGGGLLLQDVLPEHLQPRQRAASATSAEEADEAGSAPGQEAGRRRRQRLGRERRSELSPQGSGASCELPPVASLHAAVPNASADKEAAAVAQQTPPPEGQTRHRSSLRRLLHRRASGPSAEAATDAAAPVAEPAEPLAPEALPAEGAAEAAAEEAGQASAGPPAERTARVLELSRISTESGSDASSERLAGYVPCNPSNGSLSKLIPNEGSSTPLGLLPASDLPAQTAHELEGPESAVPVRSSPEDSGALLAAAAAASPEAAAEARTGSPALGDGAAVLLCPDQEPQPGSLRMRLAGAAAEADEAAAEVAPDAGMADAAVATLNGDTEPRPPSPVLQIWESVKQSAFSQGRSPTLVSISVEVCQARWSGNANYQN